MKLLKGSTIIEIKLMISKGATFKSDDETAGEGVGLIAGGSRGGSREVGKLAVIDGSQGKGRQSQQQCDGEERHAGAAVKEGRLSRARTHTTLENENHVARMPGDNKCVRMHFGWLKIVAEVTQQHC
jgi:hypothetical protein